jgi:hypothetical protein
MVLGRLGLMTVIAMSRAEIDRVHVLRDVVAERITVREAAQLLQIISLSGNHVSVGLRT